MTFAHRIQFFLPVRRCGAETQTDDVDPPKTPKETVVDRLRAADTDWLLRREVIPPLPMDRALVKGFNTRLGFYYTTLKDDSFDVLTPPPDLYGDVTAGLVFNFYDTRFIVQTPGPDKKQLCFSYCENIFGVLKSLETGEITRELALIIDKLDSRAYSSGEIVVTVNDYRYREQERTWHRRLVVGDEVTTQYCQREPNELDGLESERQIAIALNPVICTDPSPDVARMQSVRDFRAKMWLSRRKRIKEEAERTRPEPSRQPNRYRIDMSKFQERCNMPTRVQEACIREVKTALSSAMK